MSVSLFERIVLVRDLPDEGLRTGDVGTVLDPLDVRAAVWGLVTGAPLESTRRATAWPGLWDQSPSSSCRYQW